MNLRTILLIVLFTAFAGYSSWLLMDVGYFAIWAAGFENPSALQILMDLVIACLVISGWMIGDAKNRGVTVWPWLISVAATGTLAILVYLIAREFDKARVPQTEGV